MTVVTANPSKRPSRLLDLVRQIASHPGSSRVGFLNRETSPARKAVLIASLANADSEAIAAAVSAGADALELRASSIQDLTTLAAALSGVSVPVGLEIAFTPNAAVAAQAADAGFDWVRLPLETSIASLDWEKPARVLSLADDLELRLIASLGALAIDAVLVNASAGGADVTLAAALRFRAIADLVKKPVLFHLNVGIPTAVAAACDHLGADALLVSIEGAGASGRLSALATALRQTSTTV